MNKTAAIPPLPATKGMAIMSIDVEDWFHILDLPKPLSLAEWQNLPSRVEDSYLRQLDILAPVRATCFFLGWVAERFPRLVREAAARGHEIASHGFAHQLVFRQSAEEFSSDVRRAKDALEQLAGQPVNGYRAPGFSCTADVPWFFEKLVENGYRYDSSVFPAVRGHGGLAGGEMRPHWINTRAGRLLEVPITVAQVFGRRLCLFGGGYLRLFPYCLVRAMSRRVLREGRPVVFYVHPREIDPAHPRLPMPLHRRFKCYVNLRSTEPKLRRLARDFELTTFARFIAGAELNAINL
jgi:polysaccharide deacetylase family protein (PEP-CTERM system associated)